MECIVVEEDNGEYIHIKDGTSSAYLTLCGFCDISGEVKTVEEPPTCTSCIEVVKFCKSIRLPRGK